MADLVIAAAQSASTRGDIAANVAEHSRFVVAAGDLGVQLLVFPELSLTGYEPAIARTRTLAPGDARLNPLRELAARFRMAVVAGAPMASADDRCRLAAFAFLPDGSVSTYTKQHLHPGEEVFFEPGSGSDLLHVGGETVALAICADANHPEHAAGAASRGATVYAAGVLITEKGYAADARLFERYAAQHGMTVLMANHAAPTGGWTPAGKSAIWRPGGQRVVAAGGTERALVVATREAGGWRGAVVGY
jgi:predicted amidohydrolase